MSKRIVEVLLASVLAVFIVNSPAQTQFTHMFPDYPTDPIVDLMFQDSLAGFFTNEAGSVYKTLDGGLSWHRVAHYQGDPVSRIRFLDRDFGFGASPYAGLWLDKVNSIRTGSGGLWWSEADVNLSDAGDFLPLSPSVLLKSTMNGIQRLDNFYTVTTDGGATWSEHPITNRDFPPSWSKVKFTDPGHLWFENQQGWWLSRDSAKTWMISDSVSGMAFDMASNLLGVCDTWPMDRFGLTNDGGKRWSFFQKPYPNQTLDVAIVDPRSSGTPTTLLVGYDGTIFQLREGYSVQAFDSHVSAPLCRIAVVREGSSAYVWVLGSGFDILAAEYVVTGVENRPEEQIPRFALAQNYPNPFNPTTTIGYTLPRRSRVILAVYNLLGQKVAELVNGEIEPGYHDVQFDARALASGVYFYRLTAGSNTETKRLMLLR